MKQKFEEIKRKFLIYTNKIQFSILFSFFSLMIFTSGSIILYTYEQFIYEMSLLVDEHIDSLADDVFQRAIAFLTPVKDITEAISWTITKEEQIITEKSSVSAQLMGLLNTFPQVETFSIGTEGGSYLKVYRMPKNSFYLYSPGNSLPNRVKYRVAVFNKDDSTSGEANEYYDKDGILVVSETLNAIPVKNASFLYDARIRPWYIGAKKSQSSYWTDVYLYSSNVEIGITSSCPIYNPEGHFIGVVSANISMNSLSNFFKIQSTGAIALSFLFNEKGQIVAYPDMNKVFRFKSSGFELQKVENIPDFNLKKVYKSYLETGKQKKFFFEANSQTLDDIAYFIQFPASFGKDWVLGIIVLGDKFIGNVDHIRRETLIFCFLMLIISTFIMVIISKRISWPIEEVARDLRQIKNLDFDTKFQIQSPFFEISQMLEALKGVVLGLQSFGKFVPKTLVQQLVHTDRGAHLGGEKKSLTVFFSDIESFTSISEKMHSEQLLLHLSDYFEEMTALIKEHHGTLDKYIGDSIMAFWGAPLPDDQHELRACQAALACLYRLETLNNQWTMQGKPSLHTRIGISTGQMLVGNIGSSDRLQYTVLGDTVNLGARLEQLNKTYGTKILVSESTYNRVQDFFVFRPVDLVAVRGKESGIQIYELLSEYAKNKVGFPVQATVDLALRTSEAYEVYCQRKWQEAFKQYEKVKQSFPNDSLAAVFMKRCERFIKSPPAADWDGIMRTGMEF